ncbi:DUF3772 domain-containing protein [Ovoidimarina sediminis]|uniref:DUF3772 domain-containing protein n=1 Tax=Ovoidimarina sediminis TaxID=3079856 RepID=UPI00290BA244|nr:DUF3772 domain-containing protein [Rhodophyticola sp. MJ-SS7]MDU8944354.1 DUF3772 domain-containing protein [Rhodophyticola sp. MJ-SS7]
MRFVLVLLIVLATALGPGFGLAQQAAPADTGETTVDYAQWDEFATAIERLLAEGNAETSRLETFREEIAGWRSRFLDAQSANETRIATVQAQIDALGPAPNAEAGESEPDVIAEQRSRLTAQLEEARAPGVRATTAFNRANGLILEIDEEIRTRQREALLEARPSPLNPANWGAGVSAAQAVADTISEEISGSLSTEWRRRAVRDGAPVTLGLTVIGLLLLTRGRRWMSRFTTWVQTRRRRRGRILLGFCVSLGQVLLPMVGMGMLAGAILSTDILGPFGRALLSGIGAVIFGGLSAVWLTGRVFPRGEDLPATFDVSVEIQRSARRSGTLVGVLTGFAVLLSQLADAAVIEPVAEAVLALPVYAGLAFGFFWLGRVLKAASVRATEDEGSRFGKRILAVLAQALMGVAIVGPVIAALGYHNFADALMVPTAMTLGLVGLGIAFQAPIRDGYAWMTRSDIEEARAALVPVLTNFLLALAALPVLALIWGTRPAEIGEFYARLEEGITFGETRVTPGDILAVLLVLGIGIALTRLFQSALRITVLPRTRLDIGAQNAAVSFAGYAGIALSALLAVNAGGIDLTALAVVFGALSVGIGFGLQNVVQNFVAGIILLIERPISEGDWIEVGSQMGIVKDISVRSTTIETFDKQQVIVPNADFISAPVTNWTRGSQIGRATVNVGVAYGTDTRRVQHILEEIVRDVENVAKYPEPGVDFLGFGADSLDFRVRAILLDVNKIMQVKTELNHRIAERFVAEGIEIPFAQRDIWLRNPEALRAETPPPAAEEG